MEEAKNQKPDKLLFNYAKYSTIGIQMIVIICGGVFGGIQLDKWLHLKFPVFTLVLSILSVFVAMYLSVKDILKDKPKNE